MPDQLTGVLADHIKAVNARDLDALVATFAVDAYVNAQPGELHGIDAIRGWLAEEYVGDHLSVEVLTVSDHHGDTLVHGRYDGTYDKTNLPAVLILSNYFVVRDDKIVSLIVSFNPLTDKEEPALRRALEPQH